jgi:hypothetical protein
MPLKESRNAEVRKLEKTGIIVEMHSFGRVTRINTCCEKDMPTWLNPNYCPWCGAKITATVKLRRKNEYARKR